MGVPKKRTMALFARAGRVGRTSRELFQGNGELFVAIETVALGGHVGDHDELGAQSIGELDGIAQRVDVVHA